ncbi:UNVERIFIED_ORG: branched-chain amino acid transport system substrate-binding protein [Methylobacterium sp. SuP10 SLI 274]|uniref:ABC transporter substrate-binding protein n=1 Tax=Methylorubrum extorquens TaxID=408 RepID=UPI00209D480E|nr:ABC transporter substrate-binding protein [Methylorubrum extorquens]MDF9862593.1 branched-chain amino acid transport system substrate-binding protein [Methylorubrum pseudosasae]MDH6636206.1 branched-chain amino acid transport system substrate-binding protein [Methylobacterium sp. SuP10 SLI 274]MDH6665380.1 branched-chain amino acid transport system substrate-binding protein [Methylorubrum zatmanii]MCP1557306.1 branched-chain amino acid transport system substrate-binding protein [Methylorubru
MPQRLKPARSLARRFVLGALLAGVTSIGAVWAAEPVKIGLVTALSGQSAKSGEAISRGIGLAIEEINRNGGVLGRPLELVARDDEANPSKGVLAARELIQRAGVVALIGGLDTPVSMAIVPIANQMKVPFVGPWAAGTGITRNGAADNYVFRVSAVDALVDEALVAYAVKTYGAKKPGAILVNNAWGESNQQGLVAALKSAGLPSAGIEKYEANDIDMVPQLSRLREAGADALFLVGNVGPSAQVVKSLDRMGWTVPVISHWGPAGGRFDELAGPGAARVHFVQTFTFAGNDSPKAKAVLDALKEKYPAIKSMADVTPAVGIANAYDATHLIALAIQAAGATEGPKVRDGFYKVAPYSGLIKTYEAPFAPGQHDALKPDDYIFASFKNGEIVAVTK